MGTNLKIVLGVTIGIMGVIGFLLFMSPTLQLDFADTLDISCKDKAVKILVFGYEGPRQLSDWSIEEYYKKIDEYGELMKVGDCPLPETFEDDAGLYLNEKYGQNP